LEHVRHDGAPEVPPVIDAPQFPRIPEVHHRLVDFPEQFRVLLAEGDAVLHLSDGAPHELDLRIEPRVVDGDGRVEERGVETAVLQVRVGVDLVLVGADVLHPRVDEGEIGVGLLESAHHLVRAVLQGGDALFVPPHRELEKGAVVGNGEVHFLLVLRGDFQAVDGDVVEVALQPRNQIVPAILHEFGPHAEIVRDSLDDLHLEADEDVRIGGVGKHERSAALGVASPFQSGFFRRGGFRNARNETERQNEDKKRKENAVGPSRHLPPGRRRGAVSLVGHHATSSVKCRRNSRVRSFLGVVKSTSPSSFSTISPPSMKTM